MIRRFFFGLTLFAGGVYLFLEIAADVGGVLWLKYWLADEEVDKEVKFRSGRADPVLRKGEVYGVVWNPDFVAEPVQTDRIYVERHSEDVFDFERSRWEFTGGDIDLLLKDAGGKVNVGKVFVSVSDYEGVVEFELEDVVATAEGLDSPLRARSVKGAFDTANSPPEFVHLKVDGVRLPGVSDESGDGGFQGIPFGELEGELAKLGYDEAEFDIVFAANYDKKAKTMHIEELSLEGAGLARTVLSLSLKDVSRDLRIRGLADLMSEATVVKIVSARLELEDHGLVRRAMEKRAGEKGVGVGEAALEIAERWPIGATEKAAAVAFLGDPHWILIEVQPNSPAKLFDLIALKETDAILRRLGFRVTNASGG